MQEIDDDGKKEIIFKIHNVGVGSLSSIVFDPDNDDKKVLIYDAGAQYYANELIYNKNLENISENLLQKSSSSEETEVKTGGVPIKGEFVLAKLQEIFPDYQAPSQSQSHSKKAVQNKIYTIQTLIISHPDEDHYNLAVPMFNRDNIHVKNIILAGLPWEYNETFKDWIKKLISQTKNATNIYFPAISFEPVENFPENPSYIEAYAPHIFYDADKKVYRNDIGKKQSSPFGGALNFVHNASVIALSVNPNHITRRDSILRLDTDKNTDSLVIKINCANQSILLTGDATEESISNLLHLYKNTDFLRSKLFQVPHHGGYIKTLEGFLDSVLSKGTISLISHGNRNNHPRIETYNAIRKRSDTSLLRHNIFVVKKKIGDNPSQSKYKTYIHRTNGNVLTTMTSGTITSTIFGNGSLQIETGKDSKVYHGKITDEPNQFDLKDTIDEVKMDEKVEINKDVTYLTPVKQQKPKKKLNLSSLPKIDSLSLSEKSLDDEMISAMNEHVGKLIDLKSNIESDQGSTAKAVCSDIYNFIQLVDQQNIRMKYQYGRISPIEYLEKIKESWGIIADYQPGLNEVQGYREVLQGILETYKHFMSMLKK